MARYGDDSINKEKAIEKLLRIVPKMKYTQLAISIEMLIDLQALTIEEVTGRPKAVDNHDEPLSGGEVTIGGQLHLTEKEWLARQKERKKGGVFFLDQRPQAQAAQVVQGARRHRGRRMWRHRGRRRR